MKPATLDLTVSTVTKRRQKLAMRYRTPREDQHGTLTGYSYGCRCESCWAARKAYNTARKLRLAAAVPA